MKLVPQFTALALAVGAAGSLTGQPPPFPAFERHRRSRRNGHARLLPRHRRPARPADDPVSGRRRRHQRDTWLDRVEARLVETVIVAHGAVVRARDVKGRRISLDVTIDDGRIEDVLKLAVNSPKPVITERMRLKTKLLLPAGDEDVVGG